ncbi:uncharacterized protein LOC119324745 [Triticum dicoccoides]|uniref:uncharacterized protein LOC119324745 n=1 Tax=Triticum dicoccoides TaxID=85692 RepID=UPI001890CCA3|nr:uncharacterized protein LOC119324745 [Triticum dicoccoides]
MGSSFAHGSGSALQGRGGSGSGPCFGPDRQLWRGGGPLVRGGGWRRSWIRQQPRQNHLSPTYGSLWWWNVDKLCLSVHLSFSQLFSLSTFGRRLDFGHRPNHPEYFLSFFSQLRIVIYLLQKMDAKMSSMWPCAQENTLTARKVVL